MIRCIICVSCLLVIALTGCRPGTPPPVEAAENAATPAAAKEAGSTTNEAASAANPLRDLFTEARDLLGEGYTNAVLEKLEQALDAPELSDDRPAIYKAITSVMLMGGRVEETKTRLAASFKTEPDLSMSSLGAVRNFYLSQDDRDSAHAWVEQLRGLALEDRMTATLTTWQVEEYLHREDGDRVCTILAAAVKSLPGERVADVVGSVIARVVKADQADLLARILDLAEGVPDGAPRLVELAAVYRIELSAMRGNLPQAIAAFSDFIEAGDLAASRHLFRSLSTRARTQGDRAAVDNLCLAVLERQEAAAEAIQRVAVTTYCRAAASPEHFAEYPPRITKLLELGVVPAIIRNPFVGQYRAIIQSGDAELVRAMIGLAEQLSALVDDEQAKDAYLALALDGYVVLDDYRKAVAMVDQGFRKADSEWQAVMVPKLRAHLAMEEGHTQEAIQHFREFMRAAAVQTPGSAALAQTLGMNAARIGDLWRGIGEADKAQAAYVEARAHYNGALKVDGLTPEQKKLIGEQLSRIASQLEAK
jgi:tetratricopeptide (TPR) repeat protein